MVLLPVEIINIVVVIVIFMAVKRNYYRRITINSITGNFELTAILAVY